ncbi:type III-E CRISPR-associated protein Csx30 [Desulfobacterales bacterium HSG2]|nr:type III-E CRISPR-associated protein Csx30 [Desulfobacterales bacterium HSG2]
MLNDYEERQTDGFLYSPALDLLLTWGSASLFQGTEDEGEFVQGIEEEWHSLREDSDVNSELHSGLEALTRDIDDALEFLYHTIPESDRETALAQTALEILDHGVRLFQTARNFTEQDLFPEDFQGRAEVLFRKLTVDRVPSYLRLIPLNYWRQYLRGNISEHSLHLFPWYDEWADLPSETIEILIENWNEISRGNFECSEMDAETLKSLFAELSNDRGLLNYIREEARFGRILPRAIGKSLSLRLLMIRTDDVGKHAAPQKVIEKGFVACARQIIQEIKKTFRSEEERLEGIFLGGFCGPFLYENQRLELFNQVEDGLKTLDVSSLRPGSLLEELYQWSQGKVADEAFSHSVFDRWIESMSNAAKMVTESVPEEAAVFLRAVTELEIQRLYKAEHPVIDRIWETICELSRPTVLWKKAYGTMKKTHEAKTIELSGRIQMFARQDEEKVVLLEDSDSNSPELQDLIQSIKKGNDFYSLILAQNSGEIWTVYEELKIRKLPVKVKYPAHDRFILLIDRGKMKLKESAEVVANTLNGCDDTPNKKVSSKTILIDVNVLKDRRK